ncbi:prosaposin-like [Dendronephthya gigantea]|uniref:prosaposin-like n=1 Tax=Dendronephthya gigantea TaxID=151771 RepID=UPI00106B5858|nr:prosaposin-like [Dendronephthya gigantea]
MKAGLFCSVFLAVLLQMTQSASVATSADRTEVNSISDCQSCEYIMRFIRFQTLNQAQTVDAITEKLRGLFKIIPSFLQNDEYLTNLETYVKMIKNGDDPKNICKSLLKCSIENLNLPRITECEVCTAVVDLIKFELTVSNATLQLIIIAVEDLCAILGDVPVYQECKLILKEIKQIIEWIEQKLTPEDICERLGFCNKTITSHVETLTESYGVSSRSSTLGLCDMCMMVMNTVDKFLGNFINTLDEIEDELNAYCSVFGVLADQCKSAVDMVIDKLKRNVEHIEGKLDPSATCKKLHLCPS